MKKSFCCTLLFILFFAFTAFAQININTANPEQLTALKGIGPVKAEAIVRYRNENGLFKSIDEIKKVPGIGDKIFSNIKEEIIATAPVESSLEVVHQEAEPAPEESAAAIVDEQEKE